MSMFYVQQNGKEFGPLSADQLKAASKKGRISKETLIRKSESEKWYPAHKVKGLFSTSSERNLPSTVPSLPVENSVVIPPTINENPVIYVQPNVQVNLSNSSNSANSLGISSLVLGLFSFVICWMPGIGQIISLIGLLLGITGLILAIVRKGKGTGIGYAIAGASLNGIALLIGIIFLSAFTHTAEKLSDMNNKTTLQDKPWHSAEKALKLGNISLKITKVVVGVVPLNQNGKDLESKNTLLTIYIDVFNSSENKKIKYLGWMSENASLLDIDAELIDSHYNDYKMVRFGIFTDVKDMTNSASIYPKKIIKDAIVFEEPIQDIDALYLKLSGKAFEEKGEFRFKIPLSMIIQAAKP